MAIFDGDYASLTFAHPDPVTAVTVEGTQASQGRQPLSAGATWSAARWRSAALVWQQSRGPLWRGLVARP